MKPDQFTALCVMFFLGFVLMLHLNELRKKHSPIVWVVAILAGAFMAPGLIHLVIKGVLG